MSKSSNTNYPNGFRMNIFSFSKKCQTYRSKNRFNKEQVLRDTIPKCCRNGDARNGNIHNLGGYSGEVPPLPIPNREVKLASADGTAVFPWESR